MTELGVQHLGAFVVAGLLLSATPGPDLLYTATAASSGGRIAGWVAALGTSTGCLIHVALGALGVTALLAASPQALGALQLAGAAWLAWLGGRMLLATAPARAARTVAPPGHTGAVAVTDVVPAARPRPLPAVFRDAVLINLLNPKIAVFFAAFVPQFIAPQATHPGLAFAALGLLFVANGTVVTGTLGTFAAAAASRARRGGTLAAHAARWLPRAVGAAMIAAAARLALDGR